MTTENFALNTQYGELTVKKCDILEHPGFEIYLEAELIAVVEHEEGKGLRILCWGEMSEEPSHIIEVKNIVERLAAYSPKDNKENIKKEDERALPTMNFLNQEQIKLLREQYKEGMRVEFVKMDDPYTKLKTGDQGVVQMVDDAGGIHINWDCGSNLAAIWGVDEIKIIDEVSAQESSNKKMLSTILQFNFETGDSSCRYYQVYAIVKSYDYINYDKLEESMTSYLETIETDDKEYEDVVEDVMRASGLIWEFAHSPLPKSDTIHSFWI